MKIWHLLDFSIPVDQRVKIKESERINQYFYLASELRKQWLMNVRMLVIVVGALETIPTGLEMRLGELLIKEHNTLGVRFIWKRKNLKHGVSDCTVDY